MIQYFLDFMLKLSYDLNLFRAASVFINFGANVNQKYTYFPNSGEMHSLLDFAILDDEPNFINLFLEHKAKLNFMQNQTSNSVCIACFRNNHAAIEALFKHEICINQIKNAGHPPLIGALVSGQNIEIAKLLLQTTIEQKFLNHTLDKLFSSNHLFNKNHENYLLQASSLLFEHGANLNYQRNDRTPLSKLIRNSNSEKLDRLFEFLVANGANIYFENHYGHSLLFMAVMSNNLYTKKLIQAGFDIDHRNQNDMTTLMTICDNFNLRAQARHLIAFKPDLNLTRQADGNTALHFAAQSGKTMDVKTLLENGADFSIKNVENLTALDIAQQMNYRQIINLIESHIEKQKTEIQQQFMAL